MNDLGFTSSTENERPRSVWWFEWRIEYGHISCHYSVLFLWDFSDIFDMDQMHEDRLV